MNSGPCEAPLRVPDSSALTLGCLLSRCPSPVLPRQTGSGETICPVEGHVCLLPLVGGRGMAVMARGGTGRVTGRSCLHGWLAHSYSRPVHLSFVPLHTHSAPRHVSTHDTVREAVSSKTARQVTMSHKKHTRSLWLPDMRVCIFFPLVHHGPWRY